MDITNGDSLLKVGWPFPQTTKEFWHMVKHGGEQSKFNIVQFANSTELSHTYPPKARMKVKEISCDLRRSWHRVWTFVVCVSFESASGANDYNSFGPLPVISRVITPCIGVITPNYNPNCPFIFGHLQGYGTNPFLTSKGPYDTFAMQFNIYWTSIAQFPTFSVPTSKTLKYRTIPWDHGKTK